MEAIAVNFERIAARWGDDTCELDTLEFVEACEVSLPTDRASLPCVDPSHASARCRHLHLLAAAYSTSARCLTPWAAPCFTSPLSTTWGRHGLTLSSPNSYSNHLRR
jgi:hypothetical protein